MSGSDDVDRFLESLDELDVSWSRTAGQEIEATLDKVLVEPAVGVPLPFEGLTIEGVCINMNPTPSQLREAKTGVTAGRMGIASYGSLVLHNDSSGSEAVSLFPELHVAVLRVQDIVPDMEAAFERLGETIRSCSISAVLATGPSATADMGALVRGAHGPKAVHVILVED